MTNKLTAAEIVKQKRAARNEHGRARVRCNVAMAVTELRKSKTLQEIADAVGTTPTAIKEYAEASRSCSPHVAMSLAVECGITVHALLNGAEKC